MVSSLSSKFYHFMTRVADCMILSALWFITSLPLVTFGAASTALYYCIIKVVRRDEGAVVKDYFRAFRCNFRQSILVSVVALAAGLVVTVLGTGAYALRQNTQTLSTVYFVYLLLTVFGIGWLHYVTAYIARFDAPLMTVLKNSLAICLLHIPHTILLAAAFATTVLGLVLTLPASAMGIFLVPALYALIASFLLERIFRKYLPEESAPTEEPDAPACGR